VANLKILSIASLALLLLAGCSEHGRTYTQGVQRDENTSYEIPPGATIVGETTGGRLEYLVPRDGKVYLGDDTAHVIVWDGRVREGARVFINPDKNRIEIDGKEQAKIDLKRKHRFTLFYDRH
jgi:hypothetical protein